MTMFDCRDIETNIDDWLDGTLDAESLARFEQHVATCLACARTVERARRLSHDLALLGDAADRIVDSDRRDVRAAGRPIRAGRIAAAVALLLAGGYAGLLLIESPTPQDRRPSHGPVASNNPEPEAPNITLTPDDTRLAVRMESTDPSVHLIWLYDTVQPTKAPVDRGESDSPMPGDANPDVLFQ